MTAPRPLATMRDRQVAALAAAGDPAAIAEAIRRALLPDPEAGTPRPYTGVRYADRPRRGDGYQSRWRR